VQKYAISRWYRNWVINDGSDKRLCLRGETVGLKSTVSIPDKINIFHKYHHSRNYGIFVRNLFFVKLIIKKVPNNTMSRNPKKSKKRSKNTEFHFKETKHKPG
jgi:hypothetical protein